jgi:hypothetical protein
MAYYTHFSVFMWVFLFLFIATALLTIASLPGWVNIEKEFKSKLFTSLILELVGCVIAFVWVGIRATQLNANPTPVLTPAVLEGDFGWHYAPRNWRSVGHFEPFNGRYRFVANTYYTRTFATTQPSGKVEMKTVDERIFTWESDAFELPKGLAPAELVFKCKQTVVPNIGEIVGPDSPAPGTYEHTVRLKPMVGLQGTWQVDAATVGGIHLTRDTAR